VAARHSIHVPSLVSDSLVADEGTELAHAVEAPPPPTLEDAAEKELLVAKVAELEERLAELELVSAGSANGHDADGGSQQDRDAKGATS
jgi:hypothetical protein